MADGEPGAEVYGAAVDREQASIIYREAAAMVRASPELSRVLEVVESRKTIAMPSHASFYRVLSADGFRAEGLNIHGLLFDELHAQKDRRLWDALRYGGAARDQPMLVSISTAGYDRNSICYEQHQYARKTIADESIDPTFFGFIAAADEGDDWTEESTWWKANPSLGKTIKVDDFAADCAEAQMSTTKENAFKRYRLNIWTQQDTRWIKMAAWESGASPPIRSLQGLECWCGLDLATTFDTSAFVALFPDADGTFDVVCRFWIPAENAAERERRDKVPYLAWARDPASGLTLTDGNVTDYDVIRRDIVAFAASHNIRTVGVDRWNSTQLATQLQGDGLEVVGFSQGFSSMSGPSKLLENLIVGGKLRHAGNPVLSWMANNASVKVDANGNIRPVKPKPTSPDRIDGIVSLVMALGVFSESKKEPPKPPPDILFL